MPHTTDWALFVESEQWNVRGDWPGFHSVVQAYKLCLDSSLHPALMVNMIRALDPYMQRKVIKEPRPTSLDAAVALTWEAFCTADPPASCNGSKMYHLGVPKRITGHQGDELEVTIGNFVAQAAS